MDATARACKRAIDEVEGASAAPAALNLSRADRAYKSERAPALPSALLPLSAAPNASASSRMLSRATSPSRIHAGSAPPGAAPCAAPRRAPSTHPRCTFSPPALALASSASAGESAYLWAKCSSAGKEEGKYQAVMGSDRPERATSPFRSMRKCLDAASSTALRSTAAGSAEAGAWITRRKMLLSTAA